jgi:hypothetical protein
MLEMVKSIDKEPPLNQWHRTYMNASKVGWSSPLQPLGTVYPLPPENAKQVEHAQFRRQVPVAWLRSRVSSRRRFRNRYRTIFKHVAMALFERALGRVARKKKTLPIFFNCNFPSALLYLAWLPQPPLSDYPQLATGCTMTARNLTLWQGFVILWVYYFVLRFLMKNLVK